MPDYAALDASGSLLLFNSVLISGVNRPVAYNPSLLTPNSTFVRPSGNATAYTANDIIGDGSSSGSTFILSGVVPYAGETGLVLGATVETNLKSITPRVRVHLFNVSGAQVPVDNAPMFLLDSEQGKYITYFDMPAMTTPAGTSGSTLSNTIRNDLREPYICASGQASMWYALEALDAFTPSSGQTFNVKLVTRPDQR